MEVARICWKTNPSRTDLFPSLPITDTGPQRTFPLRDARSLDRSESNTTDLPAVLGEDFTCVYALSGAMSAMPIESVAQRRIAESGILIGPGVYSVFRLVANCWNIRAVLKRAALIACSILLIH